MATSSVLIDWQVAIGMGASSDEIDAYVSIRNILRTPASAPAQVAAAILELGRMATWAHAATLPDVCAAMRQGALAVVDSANHAVFAPLLSQYESQVSGLMTQALAEFSSGVHVTQVIDRLRDAAALLVNSPGEGEPDRSHFSLERNHAVAVVLAMLEVAARESPNATKNALGQNDESRAVADALMSLFDRGLRMDFGRFVLLVAVDVGLALEDLCSEDTLRSALAQVTPTPEREPDLLHRYARLACRSASKGKRDGIAELLVEELGAFTWWRTLVGDRLDLVPREEMLRAAAYWQDALLRSIAEAAAPIAVLAIGSILYPRVMEIPKDVAIELPLYVRNWAPLVRLLRELLCEAGEDIRRVHVAGKLHWSFAITPWFHPNSKRMPRKTTWIPKESLCVRMTSWAAIACELLAKHGSATASDQSTRNLGAFVLHAYYWLEAFERAKRDVNVHVSQDIAVLANAGKHLVETFAGGRYEHPEPAFFNDLISGIAKNGFGPVDGPLLEAEDHGRRLAETDREFESALLLLQRAIAVTEDENRVGRWLEDTGFLTTLAIEWFGGKERQRIPFRPLYIAKCLKRFIERQEASAYMRQDDPLDNVITTGTWLSIKAHRPLLLRDTQKHLDWVCGESQVPLGEAGRAPALTIALQRVAAAHADPTTPVSLAGAWRIDLHRVLVSSAAVQDFDRFLQFRFVEVLRSGILDTEADLIELIVRRLLEFGSNHTFIMLGGWLVNARVDDEVAANLRIHIFVSMWRYIKGLESTRLRDDAPRDPEARARYRARARVIERLLACTLVVPSSGKPDLHVNIASVARRKRDALIAGHVEDQEVMAPVEVDAQGSPLPVVGHREADLRTAVLVAYDSGTASLRRLGPPSGPEVLNLFAGAFADNGTKRPYLGVVTKAGLADARVCLDTDQVATVRHKALEPLRTGQLVAIDHGPALGGRFGKSGAGPVRSLVSARRPVAEQWAIVAKATNGPGSINFYALRPGRTQGPCWTEQTTNFLCLLAPPNAPIAQYAIPVELDAQSKRRMPAIRRFCDLLLDEAENLAGGKALALCVQFVTYAPQGGLTELVAETWPFKAYRIDARADLTAEALRGLETELARLEEQHPGGLILLLQLEVSDLGPRLALTSPGARLCPPWSRTTLTGPFDDRNLRWRAIFAAAATEDGDADDLMWHVAARRDEAGNYLAGFPEKIKIEGFPPTFVVDIGVTERRAADVRVVVDRSRHRGRPHLGQFEAEPVSEKELNRPTASEFVSLVDWILAGGGERLLSVRSYTKGVTAAGFVNAFTKENLPVQIHAESLSLKPYDNQLASEIRASRTVLASVRFGKAECEPEFDVSRIPASAFVDQLARGVLTGVPMQKEGRGAGFCRVAWRTPAGIDEQLLLIENLESLPGQFLNLGGRVTVDRRSDQVTRRLEWTRIVAEALWEERPQAPDEDALYVGTGLLPRVGHVDLFEIGPGKIALRAADPGRNPPHVRFEAEHLAGRELDVVPQRSAHRMHYRGDVSWPICLAVQGPGNNDAQLFLCGLCTSENLPQGRVRLTAYELDMREGAGGGTWLTIRRRVRLRSPEERQVYNKPARHRAELIETADEARQQALARAAIFTLWLAQPFIEGSHDVRTNRFMPADPKARRLLPRGIQIEPAGYSRMSPHAPVEAYSRTEARLALLHSEPLLGSYVDTPAATFEELAQALGSPDEAGMIRLDDLQLNYVGVQRTGDDIEHMLEWGYGCWIAIHPSRVLYKGRQIQEGELVIAFGDGISSVRLLYENEQTVLSIEELIYSNAHVLYEQASKYDILHILHASGTREQDVQIDRVEGYENRHAVAIVREFARVGATLEPTTEREVGRLIADRLDAATPRGGIVLYGRMLTEEYKASAGADVVYRGVQMGIDARTGFEGLRQGDRMFVRAADAVELRNELRLRVVPLPALDERLFDPQYVKEDGLFIARRSFSHDEGALARITVDDPRALENRDLLVRVERINGQRITLNHSSAAPPRHSAVLDGILAQAGGRLFCVFVERREGKEGNGETIVLELRPGALIHLDGIRVELPAGELERGDILRIERRETSGVISYAGVRAIYGDRRYARVRRPTVALPTNPLKGRLVPPFRVSSDIQRAVECFTVGDFRQLMATLVCKEQSARGWSRLDVLRNFMSQPHPKLAWLQIPKDRERTQPPQLWPDHARSILAGRIEIVERGSDQGGPPMIRIVPLPNANPELGQLATDWRFLTFAQGTARALAVRFASASWRYHDQTTIVWASGKDGNITAEAPPLNEHTILTGPLFFISSDSTATLRYHDEQMDEYVLGFSNLRASLPRTGAAHPLEGVVAGIPQDGGLYVEALPGRIFEVPCALCSREDAGPIALDRLGWTNFGVGDAVTLRRAPATGDRFGQEGVLLSWRQGNHNAIGPMGALMPQVSVDAVDGAAIYGAHQFTITVPASEPEKLWQLAIIGGGQALRCAPVCGEPIDAAAAGAPARGDLVFLVEGEGGRLQVAGFPGWPVVPHRSWTGSAGDLLDNAVHTAADGRKTFDAQRTVESIRTAGGAFAVDVHSVLPKREGVGGLVFVSRHTRRRTQAEALATGADPGLPQRGDVVALTFDAKNLLQLARFPNATVVPDANWPWAQDVMMRAVVRIDDSGQSRFKVSGVAKLVKAAGGTLPFTVEGIRKGAKNAVEVVFISRRLQNGIDTRLSVGTTLLLMISTKGRFKIAGLPEWSPEPASQFAEGGQIDWGADSYLRHVIERDGNNRVLVDRQRLVERIELVGGALPVTLEEMRFGPTGLAGQLRFSRRYQSPQLEPGHIALAKVLGYLPRDDVVVLAIGARYFEIPAKRFVHGVPNELVSTVVATMVASACEVWVRRIADDFHVGIDDNNSDRLSVQVTALIPRHAKPDVQNPAEALARGVICVGLLDRQLYWLGDAECAASRLTIQQAEKAFMQDEHTFEAVRLPGAGVSIVLHPRVQKQIEGLRPGVSTTVRRIADSFAAPGSALPAFCAADDRHCCLARSMATGLLITLVLDEAMQANDSGEPIAVEIVWRWHDDDAIRLAAVARGSQPLRSDIPRALLSQLAAATAQNETFWFACEELSVESAGRRILATSSSTESLTRNELLVVSRELISAATYSARVALTALLILARQKHESDCEIAEVIWNLAADIGRRALRSHHLEPLARRHAAIRRGETMIYETQEMYTRVDKLLALISGSERSRSRDIEEQLESLVLFANLHMQPRGTLTLVHALSAGLGGRHDLGVLVEASRIVAPLVEVLRPFTLMKTNFTPDDAAAAMENALRTVQTIADQLEAEDFDIPFPRGFVTG